MAEYDIPANDAVDFELESYNQPANDDVDFSLTETEPPPEGFSAPLDRLRLPMGMDLPLSAINITTMQTGIAVFLVGTLALLGGASVVLRNYAAGVLTAVAFVALIMSGTIGIGLEYYWMLIILTLVVLAAGLSLRVIVND